jgi:hypothetical protein
LRRHGRPESSTSKTAWAVSSTRHTTTAAISTGLPRLSFTLSRSPLSVRARSETL